MMFIDIFGNQPEMIPDGKDFNQVIDFLKKNGFYEGNNSHEHWKSFGKFHEKFYFRVNIQQRRIAPELLPFVFEYTYRVRVKITDTRIVSNEMSKNFRDALCVAFTNAFNEKESIWRYRK